MKILVRAPNWVGDAVMAVPALDAIRRARPEAEICVLARPSVADLLCEQPFADRVMRFDWRGRHRGWSGRESLIRELHAGRFDAAVLLQNAFEAAWIVWRAGIPERVGYARDARRPLLTRAIPVPAKGAIPLHEAYFYLELLRRAGWVETLPTAIAPIRLCLSPATHQAAESRLQNIGSREASWRVAVAPGSSYGAAKCWPAERFAQLADGLISECGADVIFFGTEHEKEIAARIRSKMNSRAISLVGETSTRDLLALFASCSLFVGNDSGAMHVAAAAGLPVIGIFGSTDPDRTSPLTDQFTLLREAVSCSPCFLRRCPVDHRCMTRISVESVLAAAKRKLDRNDMLLRGGTNV